MKILPHQHEPRGLVAIASGHTPTMSKSVCNPVPPGVQKALDRRRRFTLIRPGTRAALQAGSAGTARSASLARQVNCTPRDGRGTEAVNHFSRLPAG